MVVVSVEKTLLDIVQVLLLVIIDGHLLEEMSVASSFFCHFVVILLLFRPISGSRSNSGIISPACSLIVPTCEFSVVLHCCAVVFVFHCVTLQRESCPSSKSEESTHKWQV